MSFLFVVLSFKSSGVSTQSRITSETRKLNMDNWYQILVRRYIHIMLLGAIMLHPSPTDYLTNPSKRHEKPPIELLTSEVQTTSQTAWTIVFPIAASHKLKLCSYS